MKKRIIFNAAGVSTSVFQDATARREGPDIYDVPPSPSGFYRKLPGGAVQPISQAEWDDLTLSYAEKRRREYPPIGDQLDAILEHIKSAGGYTAGSKIQEVLARWNATKQKYPKT